MAFNCDKTVPCVSQMGENKFTLSFIYSLSFPAPNSGTSDMLRPSLIGFLLTRDLKKKKRRKEINRLRGGLRLMHGAVSRAFMAEFTGICQVCHIS